MLLLWTVSLNNYIYAFCYVTLHNLKFHDLAHVKHTLKLFTLLVFFFCFFFFYLNTIQPFDAMIFSFTATLAMPIGYVPSLVTLC